MEGFDPPSFPYIRSALHRDHRKIVVIDGKICYTGGFKVALSRLVAEGVASGELRRNVDPADAAEALYALMESVALRLLLGVEKDSRRAKERFCAVIAALSA